MMYGKLPADPRDTDLMLDRYVSALPQIPAAFGHANVIARWQMLGNDRYGDCVWAGAAHETMLWTREGGRRADFTDTSVLSDYAAVTGFDPKTGEGDSGTNMHDAADYRKHTGVLDADGKRHTIAGYATLPVGNVDLLAVAAYCFSAAGIGILVPESFQEQFNAGQVIDDVGDTNIIGGHYIPCVGRVASGNLVFVTWGQAVEVTERFVRRYMDEGFAYLSTEFLHLAKSPEGLDLAALRADLAAL